MSQHSVFCFFSNDPGTRVLPSSLSGRQRTEAPTYHDIGRDRTERTSQRQDSRRFRQQSTNWSSPVPSEGARHARPSDTRRANAECLVSGICARGCRPRGFELFEQSSSHVVTESFLRVAGPLASPLRASERAENRANRANPPQTSSSASDNKIPRSEADVGALPPSGTGPYTFSHRLKRKEKVRSSNTQSNLSIPSLSPSRHSSIRHSFFILGTLSTLARTRSRVPHPAFAREEESFKPNNSSVRAATLPSHPCLPSLSATPSGTSSALCTYHIQV